jgi:Arc/MetJ-type ribon-helix-helix transcriptional regulator
MVFGFPMEHASLTISLPQTMKKYIKTKLGEGRFSTPSEYIRSLIRDDQDLNGNTGRAAAVRRGALSIPSHPHESEGTVVVERPKLKGPRTRRTKGD